MPHLKDKYFVAYFFFNFVVLFRYGIKGAVTLKNKEGQVFDVTEDRKTSWTSG